MHLMGQSCWISKPPIFLVFKKCSFKLWIHRTNRCVILRAISFTSKLMPIWKALWMAWKTLKSYCWLYLIADKSQWTLSDHMTLFKTEHRTMHVRIWYISHHTVSTKQVYPIQKNKKRRANNRRREEMKRGKGKRKEKVQSWRSLHFHIPTVKGTITLQILYLQ